MAAIISLIAGIIETILALRFVFKLFGANPLNGFVTWIYDVSAPLIAPFVGIFGRPEVTPGTVVHGVFETATLIAFLVYGLIAAIILSLLGRRSV